MFEIEFTSTWYHHQETGFTFTVNCCAVSSTRVRQMKTLNIFYLGNLLNTKGTG